jgi:hypothetical protein
MGTIGRMLIVAGIVMAAVGGLLLLTDRIPFLGKLPGDITIRRENMIVHIPLATCLLLSLLITAVLWVIGQVRGK